MIITLHNRNSESVLESTMRKMEASDFDFYMTGSRIIGTADNSSDWDFFTTNSIKVQSFLANLGFKALPSPGSYNGYPINSSLQQLFMIFRHPCGIDVQLVYNAKRKRAIQDKILPILTKFWKKGDKITPIAIWETAYTLWSDVV